MMHSTRTVALVLAGLALTACTQPTRPRPSAAATTACRQEVDRVYSAQNRVELSTRDSRDTPFASSYNSGITSRGLSAAYGRDNSLQACLNNAAGATQAPAAAATGTGSTFVPTSTAR